MELSCSFRTSLHSVQSSEATDSFEIITVPGHGAVSVYFEKIVPQTDASLPEEKARRILDLPNTNTAARR